MRSSRNIAIIITNPNHHWQFIKPVIAELQKFEGVKVKIISLCELRRLKTPVEELKQAGLEHHYLKSLRKYSAGLKNKKGLMGSKESSKRLYLQKIAWSVLVGPLVAKYVKGVDIVLLFNDAAFPGRKIVGLLKSKKIRIELFQEGIRFPLPNETKSNEYGGSGVDAIYCWGPKSADFFKDRVQSNTAIIAAGNPRLDVLIKKNWKEDIIQLQEKYLFKTRNWMICSNPIDDQGYVTEETKWEMISQFVIQASPILKTRDIKLWIKLHPGENPGSLQKYLENLKIEKDIELLEGNIFPVMSFMENVIIMASTVGLEAVLMGKRICVFYIPHHGYQFDYIDEQIGTGIDLANSDLKEQVAELVDSKMDGSLSEQYLNKHISNRQTSAKFIANSIMSHVE